MTTSRIAAAAAALLLAASFGAAEAGTPGERAATAPAAPAAQPAGAEAGDGVAVLPFTNITGLTVDDWYGVGIAETLAAAFEGAGVPVLRGEATAAADAAAAGRALGAGWVVSGSYQRQAGRLRITARVTEVATGAVVGTSIVDGSTTDLFDLQDRLAADLQPGLAAASAPAAEAQLAEAAAPAVAEPPVATRAEAAAPEAQLAEAAAPAVAEPRVATREETAAPPVAAAPPSAAAEPPASPPAIAAERAAPAAAGEGRPAATGFATGARAIIGAPPPPVPPATINRDASGRATLRAVRLDGPLRVDGVLDEGVYETTPPLNGFVQQVPNEGAPATERTDAWIFYDDDNVYVAARLWDSAPESRWVANEMQRDSFQLIQNEYFSAAFDTFYDRRNGFAFMMNPLGGFFDFQITDEGNPNSDWNPVWDSSAGRFDGGWTVEMEIPFKSIRFRPGAAEQLWGLQLGRNIRWKNEVTYLNPVPISGGPGEFRVSAGATLTGMDVPAGNRVFEVKPYAIGGLATDVNAVPNPVLNEGTGNYGIDVKYGVTENLTADFTYNTDFAQVEVDEQQVNLTRFSLFFPEKRDFFLESRGIFDFGRGASFGGGGGPGAGRPTGGGGFFGGGDAPIIFFSRRIGLQQGRTVPISGGGRLTGRVGPFSIGALGIGTGSEETVGAEPTAFTVVRISRDILRRSRIGAIYTGRSVSLTSPGSNEVFGADGQFAFYDNVYLNGYYARSRTSDRVGDDASYQGVFTYNGDLVSVQLDHLRVGSNFNPEMGFLRRRDFRRNYATANYAPRPRSIESVRQFTFGGTVDYVETGAGAVETRIAQARFQTEFESSDTVGFDVQNNYEMIVRPFFLAPEVAIDPGHYEFNDFYASYSMGAQRRVSGTLTFQRGGFYDGTITAVGFQRGRVELTPQFSFEPGISINRIELPIGAATIPLVTSRVTYTLTPRMFFGGLIQYNSSNSSLGTNLRLRWEYQPGSELFVVYNDTRNTAFLDRAPVLENRAFIVKLTRLFRF